MGVYYAAGVPYSSELYHFGIPHMQWYVRRFQNYDGSLTEAGKQRYYGKRNFDRKGNLSKKGIDRRATNINEAHKAWSQMEYGTGKKKLSAKDLKNREYLKQLSAQTGEGEARKARQSREVATQRYLKNKNPFKTKLLYKEMVQAGVQAQVEGIRYSARFMDASMDYVKFMGKKKGRKRSLSFTRP